jgi:hypothetical protein
VTFNGNSNNNIPTPVPAPIVIIPPIVIAPIAITQIVQGSYAGVQMNTSNLITPINNVSTINDINNTTTSNDTTFNLRLVNTTLSNDVSIGYDVDVPFSQLKAINIPSNTVIPTTCFVSGAGTMTCQ